MDTRIQQPCVAGAFYPAEPAALSEVIARYLKDAQAKGLDQNAIPKAIIAPHAGYIYSGPIAASAYACLKKAQNIERVAVVAPAHRHPFSGIALPSADAFATPLGNIPVDRKALDALAQLPNTQVLDAAYEEEHALEVQLPFLQTVLQDFSLTPLLVGQATPKQVAHALHAFWQEENSLIVISSDLSHFHDYTTANHADQTTAQAITENRPKALLADSACGRVGIQGVLTLASEKNWDIELLDARNSGDTAGDKDRVVGYAAFHIG